MNGKTGRNGEKSKVNSAGRKLLPASAADLKRIWRQVNLSRQVRVSLDAETLAELWSEQYHENLWTAVRKQQVSYVSFFSLTSGRLPQ